MKEHKIRARIKLFDLEKGEITFKIISYKNIEIPMNDLKVYWEIDEEMKT